MVKSNRLREVLAEEFVKALSEEKIPWRATWSTQRAYNAVNNKDYRGVNSLWLSYVAATLGYSDPRWCTLKQANAAGWSVRKGEKGAKVEFWSVYDTKTKKTISIPESRRIVELDESRKDDMRITSRVYTVFNACQIEGIPALEVSSSVDIAGVRQQRDVLLANMGLAFREGGTQAFYQPANDSITMPPAAIFRDDYGYMATFLHECGHATGHASRLNRDLTGGFGSEKYAKEELRAEIASAFIAQALGFQFDAFEQDGALDNHKAYIQSWAQVIKDAPNELFAAIKDAERISDYLLEKGEFEVVQKGKVVEASVESIDATLDDAEARSVGPKQDGSAYDIEPIGIGL